MDILRKMAVHVTFMSQVVGQILQRALHTSWSPPYKASLLDYVTCLFAFTVLPLCGLLFTLRRSIVRAFIHFVILFMCVLRVTYLVPEEDLGHLALQSAPMIHFVLALTSAAALLPLASLLAGKLQQNVVRRFTRSSLPSSLFCLALVEILQYQMLRPFRGASMVFLFFTFCCRVLQLVLLRDAVSDIAWMFPRILGDVPSTSTLLALLATGGVYFFFETRALEILKSASPAHAPNNTTALYASDVYSTIQDCAMDFPLGSGMGNMVQMICHEDQRAMNCTKIRLM